MTKENLHILWIPSWYHSNEEPLKGCFFREQALALKQAGGKVGLVFPDLFSLKKFRLAKIKQNAFRSFSGSEEGIDTFRLNGWNLFPKFPKAAAYLWANAALSLGRQYIAAKGVPDIIHAQSSIWGGLAASMLSRAFRIPYLVTEHRDVFMHPPIYRKDPARCWSTPILRDIFRGASKAIAVSSALQKALALFAPAGSCSVMPNSTDTSFFSPPDAPPPSAPFTYFTLATLVPGKNIALLIIAFKEVQKADPAVRLLIGGAGPERNRLENLSRRLGLEKHIRFLGRLDRLEARNAYRQAHAFVLPSNCETFGVVLIEALACGLPVVSTKCGGPEDIVTDKVGRLVPLNDAEALTKAMLHVKDKSRQFDPHEIRRLAVERFDSSLIAKKTLSLYHEVLHCG